MKSIIKMGLDPLIKNNKTWKLLRPFAVAGLYMNNLRESILRQHATDPEDRFTYLFSRKNVLNGPFKGMKYFSFESVGSALYAKLLGSYEREIQEQIKQFCLNKYTEVIDIGCAEGYYAIGLALRLPEAKVYAYDTEKEARRLCRQMAKENGVADRVTIRGLCSAEELESFSFTGRGLIICDCEGYEMTLFNEKNIQNLKNCDLIIETHDFINIHISTYLHNLFSRSHDIKIIKSIDDIEKVKTYAYKEIDGLDMETKKEIFGERRPAIMEWLVCTPKTISSNNS